MDKNENSSDVRKFAGRLALSIWKSFVLLIVAILLQPDKKDSLNKHLALSEAFCSIIFLQKIHSSSFLCSSSKKGKIDSIKTSFLFSFKKNHILIYRSDADFFGL